MRWWVVWVAASVAACGSSHHPVAGDAGAGADGAASDGGAADSAPADASPPRSVALEVTDSNGAPISAFDVGTSAVDQLRTATVTVTDVGTASTGAIALSLSGSTSEFLVDAPLTTCDAGTAPGASCTVAITFRPLATGTRNAALTVTTASGVALTLPLHGLGITGDLALVPSSLDLGQAVGPTTITGTVSLVNNDATAVSVDAIDVTSLGSGTFAFEATTCGAMLAAGSSCDIAVSFTPAALGASPGQLSVVSGSTQLVAPASADGARRVTLLKTGVGTGTVTSVPAGISCGSTCTAVFDGHVVLTATPDANQAVTGWGDPGCDTSTQCAPYDGLAPSVMHVDFEPALGGANELQVDFAGDAAGEVWIDGTVCSASCTVPYTPGAQVTISAQSASTFAGFVGACATAPATSGCTFTAPSGTSTVTATFVHDAKEQWTRLLDAPVFAVAHDGSGNVIAATTTGITKLSATGTALWTVALPAVGLATGPGDTIYVVSAGHVVKLDATGTTLWTAPLDAHTNEGCPVSYAGIPQGHCIAVAPDGSVAVASPGLARWDTSGNLMWSSAFDATYRLYGQVAIDAAGIIYAHGRSPTYQVAARRFAPDGTELAPLNIGVIDYNDDGGVPSPLGIDELVIDANGSVVASESNDIDALLWQSGHTTWNHSNSPYEWPHSGVAASSTGGVAWWHTNASSSLLRTYDASVLDAAGSVSWSLERPVDSNVPPGTSITLLFRGAVPATSSYQGGQLVLAGAYASYESTSPIGWVQAFAP